MSRINLLNKIYDSGKADEIEMQYIAQLPTEDIERIALKEDDEYDQYRDLQLEQEQADRG
jgi:hypothetical protein